MIAVNVAASGGARRPIGEHPSARPRVDPFPARAAISRALETLIERGWVKRTRSKEDRRQYVLELSAAGQRMRKHVEDARSRAAERVVSLLDEEDLDAFEKVVRKLVAAFPVSR